LAGTTNGDVQDGTGRSFVFPRSRPGHIGRTHRPAVERTPQETEFFNQLLRRNFHPDRLIEAAYHTNNQNITNNHASSETKIGEIHVHTHATDAARIARDIKPALERTGLATQANYSLA
jgi:hypothetical protein